LMIHLPLVRIYSLAVKQITGPGEPSGAVTKAISG
jgi:hypothetical protein